MEDLKRYTIVAHDIIDEHPKGDLCLYKDVESKLSKLQRESEIDKNNLSEIKKLLPFALDQIAWAVIHKQNYFSLHGGESNCFHYMVNLHDNFDTISKRFEKDGFMPQGYYKIKSLITPPEGEG